MGNPNYVAGRKLEYDIMADWRERGYDVVRASGSHGLYDVVAFRVDRKPEFVQAKRVSTDSEAVRLIDKFKKATKSSVYYHQVIAVKVKGSKELKTYTV